MILLDNTPVVLGNVAPGVKSTDAINLDQLNKSLTVTPFGIYSSSGYPRVGGGSWPISEFNEVYASDIGTMTTAGRLTVSQTGLYQVLAMVTFYSENAKGYLQIMVNEKMSAEGGYFQIANNDRHGVQINQLMKLTAGDILTFNVNATELTGRLTFVRDQTTISLFLLV